jgi:hypothetical protein
LEYEGIELSSRLIIQSQVREFGKSRNEDSIRIINQGLESREDNYLI